MINREVLVKKRYIVLITIFGLLSFLFIFFLFFARTFPSHIELHDTPYATSSLHMDRDLFISQTYNNCGPYSCMAAINILTGKKLDPEKLSKEMKYRVKNNLTLPHGLLHLLYSYGIHTDEYILKNCSDEEKVTFLKNKIDEKHPVIILITIKGYLHYVTVLGYDEKGFMLFDSAQPPKQNGSRLTIIDKECTEGNWYLPYNVLLKYWNDGGVKMFFNNWALVCSK